MECCIHIVADENSELLSLSEKSKAKIILCKDKWINLDGKEKKSVGDITKLEFRH